MDTLIVTSHHHHKAARNVTSLCNNKLEGPANDPVNQLWKTKNCWKFTKTKKISDFPSALLCSRDFMMANGDVRTALGELWFLEMHELLPMYLVWFCQIHSWTFTKTSLLFCSWRKCHTSQCSCLSPCFFT